MNINKIINYLEKVEKIEIVNKYLKYGVRALNTILCKPSIKNTESPFIRDCIDLKRYMFLVVVSLVPCLLFGIYNVGRNSYLSVKCNNFTIIEAFIEGSLHVLPLILISYVIGGMCEVLFAQVRKHEVSEGFLVTGMLYPLICPPTIPWWIFIIGIIFGIIIGKEIFGGVGHNILNPALTARTFLFFSYPAFMSGDIWNAIPLYKNENGEIFKKTWTFISEEKLNFYINNFSENIDNISNPTILSLTKTVQTNNQEMLKIINDFFPLKNLFLGLTPGAIGETSVLLCLIGGLFLILTNIASWRTMFGVLLGGLLTSSVFYLTAEKLGGIFLLNPIEHLCVGGFCFGAVFMSTDPVSGPLLNESRIIYGFLIGSLCILIRLFNPAFPEGMMLSILFMNIFSPLIDNIVINFKKGINK